jgi:hypothetical protein
MQTLLQVLAALSVLLGVIVLRSVRRERLRVEHSVSWLLAAVTLLALSRAPGLVRRAAEVLGLDDPAVALLFPILMVFLAVIYRQSRILSGLKDMNITLTQRLAILEFELNQRNETQKENS